MRDAWRRIKQYKVFSGMDSDITRAVMFSITFLRIFKVMGSVTRDEDACFSEVIRFSMVNVDVGSTWPCNLCVNAIADKCVQIVDACNPNV